MNVPIEILIEYFKGELAQLDQRDRRNTHPTVFKDIGSRRFIVSEMLEYWKAEQKARKRKG
jgi:hypothetical protein